MRPYADHWRAVSPSSSSSSRRAACSGDSPGSMEPLTTSSDSAPSAYLYSRTRCTYPCSSRGSTQEPFNISSTPKMPSAPPGWTTRSSRSVIHGFRYALHEETTRKGPRGVRCWSVISFQNRCCDDIHQAHPGDIERVEKPIGTVVVTYFGKRTSKWGIPIRVGSCFDELVVL